ncbi:DUF1015 domain-containing protein [Chloroflexota bacterium]
MAEIRAFHGVHYSESLVKDLASVICPPYDIIPPGMQQELYEQSDYNFIRLEYTRELPGEKDSSGKYTRAAATLEEWLKEGILEVGESPAIYLHDHRFNLQGKEYRRRGLVALVRLAEWYKAVVRPHEGTLTEPKSDRLNLLWALQANTSSVFTLFADSEQQVASLLARQESSKPMLNIQTAGGESHRIWAITDADVINRIRNSFTNQPLYIADGHHRYESALAYSHERRACSPSTSAEEPYDFVMMTLVDFADPGLVILPAHRLVRGMSEAALNELLPELRAFFDVEEVPLNKNEIGRQVDTLLAKQGDEIKLLLVGLDKEHIQVLRLRDFAAASRMMPYFHTEIYKRLDVSILDHVILEKLLGLGFEKEESALSYSYDRVDAVNKVLNREFQIALLLNPIESEVIKDIADAGDRMPRKSTYFYPKVPAGLVFHKMV